MSQIIKQSKSDHKGKAIASFVLGMISIMLLILKLMIYYRAEGYIFYLIAFLTAIFGLILGMMSLESTKRNFAIVGIVLCLIGLLVPLYSYFI